MCEQCRQFPFRHLACREMVLTPEGVRTFKALMRPMATDGDERQITPQVPSAVHTTMHAFDCDVCGMVHLSWQDEEGPAPRE